MKASREIRALRGLATTRNTTATALANASVASHPAVSSVVVGINRTSQFGENLKDFDNFLSESERADVTAMFPTEPKEERGGGFPAWRNRADVL